jgi:hypothetical protein
MPISRLYGGATARSPARQTIRKFWDRASIDTPLETV